MDTYRLIVHHEGRLLGHFDAAGPRALADVDLVATRLGSTEGYSLELFVAQGERRLLETRPDSIRVLSAEPLFTPCRTWAGKR